MPENTLLAFRSLPPAAHTAAADAAIDIGNMGSRGPPDIGGLISLKVDNFPYDMTCARPQHRGAPRHPRDTDRCHSVRPRLLRQCTHHKCPHAPRAGTRR